jgi:hypothetical protein
LSTSVIVIGGLIGLMFKSIGREVDVAERASSHVFPSSATSFC